MSGIEHGTNQSYSGQRSDAPLRLAVLISGSGSNLQALIDAIENQQLPGVEIALVISNKAHAYGLQRALKHKLPVAYIPWKKREEAEEKIASLIQLFQADLVVLAGWMRILSANFTAQFPQRMINLHPALLPDDGRDTYTTSDGSIIPALRGLHVVEQALERGIKVTGSTVHYVIPEVDAGPVIGRAEITIEEGDTADSLHEKLKIQEHRLIVEAVRAHSQHPPCSGSTCRCDLSVSETLRDGST
ncbi:phosphoribosylglycinamide formyltransferase [Dictyobacter vulcani]|uniref:Phosphoribosylglycinamide formyltransferase n=1 Tax=Dictyobacter vulcani TaxID=2607529 RepID=A0A5J4KNM5_9CHLR|nr:phosphoribosylglycinamide formyltransferase [Dictyobacter vulcani]GER87941.1 phosphoribosylglycinamide formyltransferase [Dictyobacter vulcani]